MRNVSSKFAEKKDMQTNMTNIAANLYPNLSRYSVRFLWKK